MNELTDPSRGADAGSTAGSDAGANSLRDAGAPSRDGSVGAPPTDGGGVVDAGGVFVLPDGAVSSPGAYEGFGKAIYDGYALSSQYVAVRDGTKLAVDLYRPKSADGTIVEAPLPVVWMHSPYNRRTFASPSGSGLAGETYPGAAARLIPYGYVVAIADFRGLYASYGKNAGFNRGEWVDAARLDAYDITEWLAKQPFSNGKVGMWGCSATGGSQLQAATTAPPHLAAIFPMSCEFDAYPFGVPGGMSAASGDTKAPPGGVPPALRDSMAQAVDGDSGDQLRAAIAEHAGNIENPGYTPLRDSVSANIPVQWWLKSSPHTYLEQLNASGIAMYLAANWDEAATKYGAFFTLNNVTAPNKLIVGPAAHCAWFTVQKDTGLDIAVEERRFFDHWLKGIDNGVMSEPRIYYYTYNTPKEQAWRSASAWPLPEEKRVPYYLGSKTLGRELPVSASAKDELAVQYDVTAANAPSKGLVYETAALDRDVRVTGHAVAELWVSSTATDGDFVATLYDVAPDDKAVSYNIHGRLRASHRKEQPAPYENLGLPYHPFTAAEAQPLVPGEPAKLRFDLLPISIVFPTGHRIRLVITFSDPAVTPVVQPAPTVAVYHDSAHPSSITLPVIEP